MKDLLRQRQQQRANVTELVSTTMNSGATNGGDSAAAAAVVVFSNLFLLILFFPFRMICQIKENAVWGPLTMSTEIDPKIAAHTVGPFSPFRFGGARLVQLHRVVRRLECPR